MKFIKEFEGFFGNFFNKKYKPVIPNNDKNFNIGDIVKFNDDSKSEFANPLNIYKIMHIAIPDNKISINKGIALRPITNKSEELKYMSGDFINITSDELDLLTKDELDSIQHILTGNKYNI